MRIHITGGPGTGKTTLARELALRLGFAVFDLDGQALDHAKALEGRLNFEALAASRLAEAQVYATEDAWICEGSNILVATPFLERADTIVVLYCPWRVASYRIILRHFKANLAGNNRFPGIRNLIEFWRWCRRYYRNEHPFAFNDYGGPATQRALVDALTPYEAKLVRCRTRG
jgi:adenylate kinase family enzyme